MKNRKMRMRMLVTALLFGLTMMGCGAFTDMYRIPNYLLLANRVGRSMDGPIPLTVNVNLDHSWESLVNIINSSGVYVNLDLSRSTITDTEFNPGSNGSMYIVSLVLPNEITGITGDFNIFPSLTRIRFPASADIGDVNPFVGCSLLTFSLRGRGDLSTIENGRALVRGGSELVSYPSASGSITLNQITSIGRSAFNRTGVENISLPAVTTVGIRAFRGCEFLETVNLPAAAVIDEEAFFGNTGLHTLNIPSAVSIGNNAVASAGNTDLTITMGSRIETIGTGMFNDIEEQKNVIISVPQSGIEAATAMRDALRGRGWSEDTFTLAAQRTATTGTGWWAQSVLVNNFNTNINLTIEGY